MRCVLYVPRAGSCSQRWRRFCDISKEACLERVEVAAESVG